MSQQTLFSPVATRTDAEGQRWWRPPHFLVFEWGEDHTECGHKDWVEEIDCETPRYEVSLKGAYNDEREARKECNDILDLQTADFGVGLFNNWTGDWVIEPPEWWDVEPLAEGWARYEVRPAGAA